MLDDANVNILLVDDRPENLKALESILGDLGHTLVRATSGAEALRQLLNRDFAVILLDVQMPDMDGFETAQLIRSRPRSEYTPIIFLTALDRSDTSVFKGYSVGAVDFIFKPLVPEVLRFKVTVFVDLFKKSEEIQRQAQVLEQRVRERTAELTAANEALRAEIVERERAEEALRFLTDATSQLASSLDYDQIIQKLAQLPLPYLADTCIVDMAEEDGAFRSVVASRGDARREELLRKRLRPVASAPEDFNPISQVFVSGTAEVVADLAKAGRRGRAGASQYYQALNDLGFVSLVRAPVVGRSKPLGVISLLMGESGRHYGQTEVALAEDLGRRSGLALENGQLYRAAQEALQVRDQFLSIAAHELKTPITAMLGYAQLLQRRAERSADADPRNRQALRILSDQAQRLDRLIASLLDLSRIQMGQFTIDPAPLDLNELVQRIIEEAQPSLEIHSLVFAGPGTPLPIVGDELRLAQVLQNLLQNAVKYSPSGGVIEVRLAHNGAYASISVADQGIGIPADALPQLFARFYRADNVHEPQISGMGLGLYVVSQIVALHGGVVEVASVEGEGSAFTILL
ncbi:MAG TPA: ATP-binding protein, partial [Herpetosiphonaceae bacterium]